METPWVDKLKVVELRSQLRSRGIPGTGKKAELQERLRKALFKEEEEKRRESMEVAEKPPETEEAKEEKETETEAKVEKPKPKSQPKTRKKGVEPKDPPALEKKTVEETPKKDAKEKDKPEPAAKVPTTTTTDKKTLKKDSKKESKKSAPPKEPEAKEPPQPEQKEVEKVQANVQKDSSSTPAVDTKVQANVQEGGSSTPAVDTKGGVEVSKEPVQEQRRGEIDDLLGEDEVDDMAFELERGHGGSQQQQAPKKPQKQTQPPKTPQKTAKPTTPAVKKTENVAAGGADERTEKSVEDKSGGVDKDQVTDQVKNTGEVGEKKGVNDQQEGGGDGGEGQQSGGVSNEPQDSRKRKLEGEGGGSGGAVKDVQNSNVENNSQQGTVTKRKRIPIPAPPVQEPRQPPVHEGLTPAGSGGLDRTRTGSGRLPFTHSVDVDLPATPPAPKQVHKALRIQNFVRPFTEKACREMLSQYGKIVDMWMPSIKTHCFIIYETDEQALECYNKTWNFEWPKGGRRLIPQFVAESDAQREIEQGKNRGSGARLGSGDFSASAGGVARSNPNWGVDNRLDRNNSGFSVGVGVGGSGGHTRRTANQPLTLEDLFFKTRTMPPIYYLPLTEEQIAEKKRKEGERNGVRQNGSTAARGGRRDEHNRHGREEKRPRRS